LYFSVVMRGWPNPNPIIGRKGTTVARKVEVQLIDDIDGGRAEESIRFGLDGVTYEIDLSKKNAAKLRGGLEPYLKVAQKLGRVPVARVASRGRGVASARSDREQNQAIREWALRKGLDVSPRGRIARSIIEQYEVEAGR
jgi:Lsr2